MSRYLVHTQRFLFQAMLTALKTKVANLQNANFIIRCTFGISIVALLIMLPFGINNFIQGRFLGGVTALLVAALCMVNAFLAIRGRYNLYINFLGFVPALVLASITALVTLQGTGSFWPFVCMFAIYFVLPFRFAKHASWIFLCCVLFAAWTSLDQALAVRFSAAMITITIFIFIFSSEVARASKKLEYQAETDPLTGLLNRKSLVENISKAICGFESGGKLSTMCIIDIDHFKEINDKMGHEAGDSVLIALASQLKKITSRNDLVFRVGGEEFLLLMTNTALPESQQVAEAIREVIATTPFYSSVAENKQRESFNVTVSIGLSQVSPNTNVQQWMSETDENLYLAKKQGRNRVVT